MSEPLGAVFTALLDQQKSVLAKERAGKNVCWKKCVLEKKRAGKPQ